jgi:hypothetical protein
MLLRVGTDFSNEVVSPASDGVDIAADERRFRSIRPTRTLWNAESTLTASTSEANRFDLTTEVARPFRSAGRGTEMGSFQYDRCQAVEIEDRVLAHLQTVILDKLRRNESFAFDVYDSKHWVTVWVSQRTPLEFRYSGNRHPALNRDWLELLADEVGMHGVLRLVPEPEPARAPDLRMPDRLPAPA